MPAQTAAAYQRLREIAGTLSGETRKLVHTGAGRDVWLEVVRERARRDVEGELLAAAGPLLRGRRRADDPVRRVVTEITDAVNRLRRFAPDWSPEPAGDGELVYSQVPGSAERYELLRVELIGLFERLAGLLGTVAADPGDDLEAGDRDPLDVSPVRPAMLSVIATTATPPTTWKEVAAAIPGKPSPATVRWNGNALHKAGYLNKSRTGIRPTDAGLAALARLNRRGRF